MREQVVDGAPKHKSDRLAPPPTHTHTHTHKRKALVHLGLGVALEDLELDQLVGRFLEEPRQRFAAVKAVEQRRGIVDRIMSRGLRW